MAFDPAKDLINDLKIQAHVCSSMVCPASEVAAFSESVNFSKTTATLSAVLTSPHQGAGLESLLFEFKMAALDHRQYRIKLSAGSVMKALHQMRVSAVQNDVIGWNRQQLEAAKLFMIAFTMSSENRADNNRSPIGFNKERIDEFQQGYVDDKKWERFLLDSDYQGTHEGSVPTRY